MFGSFVSRFGMLLLQNCKSLYFKRQLLYYVSTVCGAKFVLKIESPAFALTAFQKHTAHRQISILQLVLEGNGHIPNLIPRHIESIKVEECDAGPGNIKLFNFAEGSELYHDVKYLKLMVNRLDKENMTCKYTIFEGVKLPDKVGSISCDTEMGEFRHGGCEGAILSMFHPKPGVVVNKDEIRAVNEKAISLATFEAIEASSLSAQANPSRAANGGVSGNNNSGNKSFGQHNLGNNALVQGSNNFNNSGNNSSGQNNVANNNIRGHVLILALNNGGQ